MLYNSINDISALSDMTVLSVLDITSNSVSDLSALANSTDLRKLYLEKNEIESISPLSGIKLSVLDLAQNKVSDISDLDVSEISALNASGYVLLWESDNTDVAEVDANGVVKGKSAGTATITAATEDGTCVDSYTVNVSESMIYNIAVNGNTASLTVKNITDTNYDSAVAAAALCDNDEVKEIKIVNINDFKMGDTRNISAEFSDIGSGDCLQIFLWSDFASMYPIADKAGYKLFV